jgi:hypothetical protein
MIHSLWEDYCAFQSHVEASPAMVRGGHARDEDSALDYALSRPRADERIMDYDLGYFDHETWRPEPIENSFGPKVLPMYPV